MIEMIPTKTMMANLLTDMGFEHVDPEELRVPGWAYDLAERILEAGWRHR